MPTSKAQLLTKVVYLVGLLDNLHDTAVISHYVVSFRRILQQHRMSFGRGRRSDATWQRVFQEARRLLQRPQRQGQPQGLDLVAQEGDRHGSIH